jgi:translation initiation factor IF-2
VLGSAEVRATFKIKGVGTVAGCYVLDGKMVRNANARLIRDGVVIYTGKIESLKRFKEDVQEVARGFECGIKLKDYNDVKVGDVIECYEVRLEKPSL